MLHAEQKVRELRRALSVIDDCLAEVQLLLGQPGMPAETPAVYNSLLTKRAQLLGELEAAEIELLRGLILCGT
jgi:hypothetical protein